MPSLPIPIPPTPKKTTVSYQNPTLQTPSSPKHPGTDAREVPHHQMTREITVDHAHKVLLLPREEAEHDTPIEHRLIGAYLYDTCMHWCPYTPHRRCHGVEGNRSLIPVRASSTLLLTIPRLGGELPTSLQIRFELPTSLQICFRQ